MTEIIHFFPLLAHRAIAAFRALSARCSRVNFFARAFPPFNPPSLPSATAAAFFSFAMPNNPTVGPRLKAGFLGGVTITHRQIQSSQTEANTDLIG